MSLFAAPRLFSPRACIGNGDMVGVAETAADGVALAPLPAPAVALSPRPELQLPCSDWSFLSFLEQTGGVADANIEDSFLGAVSSGRERGFGSEMKRGIVNLSTAHWHAKYSTASLWHT